MTDSGNGDEKRKLADQYEPDESATNENDVHLNMDDSTVKFIQNGGAGNHNAKGEPHGQMEPTASFTGLGKEELMKYADDPFWKRTRLVLFISFWVGWIGMLVAAIIIIVLAPRCPYRPDQKWFDKETVYQVYPKSFKDTSPQGDTTSGSGVGDLQGVIDKLSYFEDIHVKTLYLNSFMKSGGADGGMDVTDFQAVDPMLGTMADFDKLRKLTKSKMMHIIMDFIPNHTSRNHTWFMESQKKTGAYKDYYIWAPCSGQNNPPNNWKNAFGDQAWSYDAVRGECYLHQYLNEEPDLNLQNDDVINEIKTVARFWLDKGIDGFVIQGADRLVENAINATTAFNAVGSASIIAEIRAIAETFATKPGKERCVIVSATGTLNETRQFFASGDQKGANYVVTNPYKSGTPADLITDLQMFIQQYTADSSMKYSLSFGNQDSSRLGSLVGTNRVKAFLALQMLLPGMPISYYGNEIGLVNGNVPNANTVDTKGRDNYRTPMQWDNSANAGFSQNTPWLPVNTDYIQNNVKAQNAYFSDQVHDETSFRAFKNLAELRTNESFSFGETQVGNKEGIIWFTRQAVGFDGYLVLINLSPATQTMALTADTGVPSEVELVFHSHLSPKTTELNLKEKSVAIGKDHVMVLKHAAKES